MADSVDGYRLRPYLATRTHTCLVLRSQVAHELASRPGTEKKSLADNHTKQNHSIMDQPHVRQYHLYLLLVRKRLQQLDSFLHLS